MRLSAYPGSTWLVAVLVTAAATMFACDDGGSTPPPPKQTTLKNLTEKSHVLDNIEFAYNARRADTYAALLDQNFTFFYTQEDVAGPSTPVQWDRAEEVHVNTRLFDRNDATLPCQSIFMDIHHEDGVTWTESDSPYVPGEKWYTTTLFYSFRFEFPGYHLIPMPGAKAQFTVRDAGPKGSHRWQLVEMRDLGGPSLINASSSATETSTWGQVKGLYR